VAEGLAGVARRAADAVDPARATADLARLVPGGTLPLHLDQRGLVTLRLGERALARGELVDVDGAVGVRILSMELAWPPAASPADDPDEAVAP